MQHRRGSTWIAAASIALSLALPLANRLYAAGLDVNATTKDLGAGADYRTRVAAALALGNSGDPRARKPLETALDDPHPAVRVAVAAALGKLGDKAALPALQARAKKEANAPAKSAITHAIEMLESGRTGGPATAATANVASTATISKAVDWAKTKFVVKVQKAENTTRVRGDALATVLASATRDRLGQFAEVFVLPDDPTAAATMKLAASKGVPVLGVNASLVSMDQGSFAGDVKVQAKVSLAFTKLEIVRASIEGNASSIGSQAASKNPDSLAKLQDMAVDGAVSSAMSKAPSAMRSASN